MRTTPLLLPLLLVFSGCAAFQPPRPFCSPTVAPISGNHLIVSIPVNFNYTPKDQSESAITLRQIALDRLNELGTPQSNSFELQNGQTFNFDLAYNVNNYNETFTASLVLSGWGQGWIHTFGTSGSYNDPERMIRDLADQAYEFIRLGWHDTTPNCVPR